MNKRIEEFSDPEYVFNKAHKMFGDDIIIAISSRKGKKYMIKFPWHKEWIHFGSMGYQDYTKHMDNDRRDSFISRNKDWAHRPIYTPAFLSFHLLW